MKKKIQVADMFRCTSPQPNFSFSAIYSASVSVATTIQSQNIENPTNVEVNTNFQQNVSSHYIAGILINTTNSCSVAIKVYSNCLFPSER